MATKKALIVWGGWEGHTPERSAHVVGEMLTDQGFNVDIDARLQTFADPNLARYDLIIPAITMSTIEKEQLDGLLSAVRAGTGIAGFHGLMCDTFRNEPAYQFMTGGQWVAHPGDIIDYRVTITRSDDPIVAGIGDFDYRSEQYYMHVDPSNEVLATTRFDGRYFDEIDGVEIPVIWKRRYGEGRVFFSSLGHVAEEFKVSQMRTIFERGALWAARA